MASVVVNQHNVSCLQCVQLADEEKLKKLLSRPGIDGRTALHAAAAAGREDVVEKLLLLGCDPEQRLGTDSLKSRWANFLP